MVWKVYDETYRKVKGYTFIEKSYHSNLPEYYFMVKKGGFTGCLLKSYDFFTKAEKDKAIADYLSHKIKAFKLGDEYKNAKEMIKLVSFNGRKY